MKDNHFDVKIYNSCYGNYANDDNPCFFDDEISKHTWHVDYLNIS